MTGVQTCALPIWTKVAQEKQAFPRWAAAVDDGAAGEGSQRVIWVQVSDLHGTVYELCECFNYSAVVFSNAIVYVLKPSVVRSTLDDGDNNSISVNELVASPPTNYGLSQESLQL